MSAKYLDWFLLVRTGALLPQLFQQRGLADALHSDDHQLHASVRLGVLQHGLEVADHVHRLVLVALYHRLERLLQTTAASVQVPQP